MYKMIFLAYLHLSIASEHYNICIHIFWQYVTLNKNEEQ